MALSMEEQRILGQIEIRLREDDPRLAQRLDRLGAPRGRRARTIVLAAVAVVIVLAAVGAGIAAAIL